MLMESGILLYNVSRSLLKSYESMEKDANSEDKYLLIMTRFTATKVMAFSLLAESDRKENLSISYIDDCIDVLRSLGRVGLLSLQNIYTDASKSSEYLLLACDTLAHSSNIWSKIGLSYLTKVKHNTELEEILEDLWDFSRSHMEVLTIMISTTDDNVKLSININSLTNVLHELQELCPYVPAYTADLLKAIKTTVIEFEKAGKLKYCISLIEESIRISDSIEVGHENATDPSADEFKQFLMLRLFEELFEQKDYQRAETCYSFLPNRKDPSALLVMLKLCLSQKQYQRAKNITGAIIEQNNFEKALLATKTIVQAEEYSADSLMMYDTLRRQYGGNCLDVDFEEMCDLMKANQIPDSAAFQKRVLGLNKRLQDSESDTSAHLNRLHRCVFELTHDELKRNSLEICRTWAEVGLNLAFNQDEAACYMRQFEDYELSLPRLMCKLAVLSRILSQSFSKGGSTKEGVYWAKEASKTDHSKKSLFLLFGTSLVGDSCDSQNLSAESLQDILKRDDVDVNDMIALCKLAYDSKSVDTCYKLSGCICEKLSSEGTNIGPMVLPVGALLQSVAQMLVQRSMDANRTIIEDQSLHLMEQFVNCSRKFTSENAASFGSSEVFEWFYALSFRLAKKTNSFDCYLIAATIAERCSELYPTTSKLQSRSICCKMAAICIYVQKLESLDRPSLQKLSDLIELLLEANAVSVDTSLSIDRAYLGKCALAVKLRLGEEDTSQLLQMCKAKFGGSTLELTEAAELVLYTSSFAEVSEIRDKYLALARDIYKHALQILLQQEKADGRKLGIIFRRIVQLAETRQIVFEWLEQFLQVSQSIDVEVEDIDAEWLLAKSWNLGVHHYRCELFKQAKESFQQAISLIGRSPQN
ncbi:unnamed protein product [Albugo candida]|uniref:Protein ZIP4 homolog n=2 Tax=Albugo candida TaxID=65357 RepID=A0A024GAU5_9STRA|nr:unnamed protein product [Albugo candida]|eukprot:CCI43427.1 unnamed protein product [Albugo candida]